MIWVALAIIVIVSLIDFWKDAAWNSSLPEGVGENSP